MDSNQLNHPLLIQRGIMKFHTQPPDVLIVGAGPVGLFTALNLTRRNIPVRIIDKATGPGVHSYALTLHAATLDLLKQYGLLESILRFALPVNRIGVYVDHKRVSELDLKKRDGDAAFIAVIPQSALESILIEALAREGISVEWNHRLASLHLEAGEVTGKIEGREQRMMGYATTHMDWMVNDVRPFHVPYLVGADGHDSIVRQLARIPFPPTGGADNYAIFELETRDPIEPELELAFVDETLNIGWPLSRFRCRWSFQVDASKAFFEDREKEREYVHIGDGNIQNANIERLREFLAQRAPAIGMTVQRVDWRMLVRFEHALADYFSEGNICLVGDAAHSTSPAGVQSMNLGLAEAESLSVSLAEVLLHGGTHDPIENWALHSRSNWIQQMNIVAAPEFSVGTNLPLAPYADRLVESLPAAGQDLRSLLEQLDFHLPANSNAAAHL